MNNQDIIIIICYSYFTFNFGLKLVYILVSDYNNSMFCLHVNCYSFQFLNQPKLQCLQCLSNNLNDAHLRL